MSDSPLAHVSWPRAPFIGREFNFWKRRREIPFHKTEAELSLLDNLQGNSQVAAPTQAKSASVPNTKGPDVKPRLLLMGLRRQVFAARSRTTEILTMY
jgi:Ras-related GTP-binding protein C/D